MKKVYLTFFVFLTVNVIAFASCQTQGDAAYDAAIANGTSEEQAAAIALAVIDACEEDQ
ncbi:hypothetical protein [Leeuwenhoekiella marinoflava]|uniref:Uncharacterized protein n=2 Tax=Leeuwenhoekiella marinoflava TaxID=988 RepID=A0A4V1KSB0_9FLAO|nr:hypothetical protein [Leeuwenhoekiella marinoflava]RXG29170.1 hypothetical protein DSL99_2108 [Leeuwenhoekiella marinoflava]SHF33918.1 hypothetical protein SAMN02745246_02245 [Leeuwenhoekiella marinoflava DSM 3653]